MFKTLFSFFLIIHILGDFYFQNDGLAGKKKEKYKYVAFHSLIYLLVSCIFVIPFWSVTLLISAMLLSVSHFAVDSIKFVCTNRKESDSNVFVADQLVHIFCIAVAASVLSHTNYELKFLPGIDEYLSTITKNPNIILAWAGLALASIKPANITIKRMVLKYKPEGMNSDNSNSAGAFIGTLERIIILLLLSVNQYSAIGLVLTAKSVARYNKISEDKKFGEYYLLGTLLSTLYAISIYFVFM